MQRRSLLLVALGIAVVALCDPTESAAATTRVDLVIDEPLADRKAAWPITTGVPFPRGKLSDAEHCRLIDDQGQEQPLQARVAATWDADRKSVRWLTIDFIAEPGRKYALEFGDDVGRRFPLDESLRFSMGNPYQLITGPLRVEFSPSGPNALRTIEAHFNADSQFRFGTVVATGAADGEHFYVDQNGQRFTSAADGADRRIVVESSGPVRACVRVDGFYTGPKGERIAKYRTRYHFFAGLPLVKVVDELGFIGSTKQTRFADIGFALDLKLKPAGRRVTLDASGEPGNQSLDVAWNADTQSIASVQKTFRHYGNLECEAAVLQTSAQTTKTLAQPERMGEWLQVADEDHAVTGSLRWFWQQFPKEWEATPNQLVLHLWSPHAGELDFGAAGIEQFFGAGGAKYLRAGQEKADRSPLEPFFLFADVPAIKRGAADGLGINKHHEFWLHFGPANRRDEGAEYGRLAAQQPLALASGEWNCATDVFGPLAARPNDSPADITGMPRRKSSTPTRDGLSFTPTARRRSFGGTTCDPASESSTTGRSRPRIIGSMSPSRTCRRRSNVNGAAAKRRNARSTGDRAIGASIAQRTTSGITTRPKRGCAVELSFGRVTTERWRRQRSRTT
ncbi:MAG: hypothetical protein FD138_2048 [Planctomycetota bacterium]|nr:MAG: hypothetical protein FD138_2048 [Planctomycetota bacterium]